MKRIFYILLFITGIAKAQDFPTRVLTVVNSDTGRNVTSLVTGGSLNKVRDSLQANITSKGLTVGTTAIGSGTTTRILYDNAGILGEYTLTGTGTVVAMQTTPTFSTNITSPLLIGGNSSASSLALRATSGAGTSGSDIIFQVGNNGATEAMRISSDGFVSIGGSVGIFSFQGASAGFVNFETIAPNVFNNSTAGYRGIYLSSFESTLGSGANLLIDVGTNTAANAGGTHTSKFNVTNTGSTTITGSITLPYVSKTTTYSVGVNDYAIDCTSGTFTVTLPTAVGITGKIYVIANSGAGIITIATTSSQTFTNSGTGTATSLSLAARGSFTIQSTGANWILQ